MSTSVTTLRTRLRAAALLAAILGASAGSAFAEVRHAVCAVKQHECGQTARIASCCCDGQDDSSSQSGPTETKVQIATHVDATATLPAAAHGPGLPPSPIVPFSTPPRAGPDRSALFSVLLI